MAPSLYHFFGICFLLLASQSILVLTKNLKPEGQNFESFKGLEGTQKGQVVKGLSDVKHYLNKFGYLTYNNSKNNLATDEFDEELEYAIKAFQENHHFNVTGKLDSGTIAQMMIPRCAVPDYIRYQTQKHGTKSTDQKLHLASHFTFFPGTPKWPEGKTHLTYTFHSSVPVVALPDFSSVCAQAFQKWADICPFTFEELPQGAPGDIEIGFYQGDHGDGVPFDGPGGTLAHCFGPNDGRLHCDADENWSSSTVTNPGTDQMDLESVILHEIGHVLGLGHSTDQSAVMFASIPPGVQKRDLTPDDIQGILALYSPD